MLFLKDLKYLETCNTEMQLRPRLGLVIEARTQGMVHPKRLCSDFWDCFGPPTPQISSNLQYRKIVYILHCILWALTTAKKCTYQRWEPIWKWNGKGYLWIWTSWWWASNLLRILHQAILQWLHRISDFFFLSETLNSFDQEKGRNEAAWKLASRYKAGCSS